MNLKISLLFFCIITSFSTYSQGDISDAWKYFNNNDLNNARKSFEKATAKPTTAAEAHYMIAQINEIDKPADECFDEFLEFYSKVDNPNPYLMTIWYEKSFMNGRNKLTKKQLKWIETALESGKLNSTITARVYAALGYHYEKINKYSKANDEFAKIGAIMEWQLAGHFENISGSGFNKDYPPISNPSGGSEFINKNGAKVKWFNLPKYRPGQWITPGSHSYSSQSIIFAQTFIKSDKDQEVQLRLGVSGSIKVFVNDKLAFIEEDERDTGMDTYTFTAKLNKGYNRIVLQLGKSDDVNTINYLLRITDNNGKLVPNLQAFNSPKPYTKEESFESKVIPNFTLDYFETKYEKDQDNLFNMLMLAKAYLSLDNTSKARRIILKAQEKAPKSSYVADLLMDVYVDQDAETLLSLELEKLRKNDPNHPLSLELEFEELTEKEDWDKAGEIVDKIEDLTGKTPNVYTKRISLLFQEEKTDEAFDLIDEAYKLYPNNSTFVDYKYRIQLYNYKNNYAAMKILRNYMKNNYSPHVESMVADLYLKMGNYNKMLKIKKSLLEKRPHVTTDINELGQYFHGRQDYYQAIEYFNIESKLSPYVSTVYSNLAQCYKELDQKEKAVENFEKALALNPNSYETRALYRKYVGKQNVYDYFDEPDLYALYKESSKAEDYPEDNSVFLWRETQKVVYESGGCEEKHYLLVKVFNPTGVDTWKEYYVGDYRSNTNIEKAEVLKKDGNIVKAETSGGHIVFTNLEEGDAILIIYKQETYQWGSLMKHFWDRVYFNIFYPYETTKYSLLVQGDKHFEYKMNHSEMKPTLSKPDDEFSLYVWERKNEPSIKSESYMPSLVDFAEVLHISSVPDWQFVNDWYYNISTTKAKADFEVQELIAELFEGKENLSDLEKAKIIYKYVVEEIRYSSVAFRQSGIVPKKASQVINTKVGDCKDVSTLFIAMCKEVGIKAEIVLVNTHDNGEQELSLPEIGFNHAIAKAYIDGKEYFVELTSDYNAFSTYSNSLKNAFVLEISNTEKGVEPHLLNPNTKLINGYKISSKVNFDGNKMQVERKTSRYGTYAAGVRSKYRDIGKEIRLKEMQEAISGDFAKAKVHAVHFDSTTLYSPCDSLCYKYNFDVKSPFTMLGDISLMEIPFNWKQEPIDFVNNENRQYPISFWMYSSVDLESETIEIEIPKGKRLYEKPKNCIYDSKWGKYSLTFVQKGNTLIVKRKMTFTDETVVQVKDLEEFSEFYNKIIKADQTQIGFK